MSKHLSKEELEHDALVENVEKASKFVNENRTILLSVLIIFFVVAGALVGYQYYADSQESKAQNLLATAERFYQEGDYDKALNGDTYNLTYGFAAVANDFSGTNAGNLALYYASVSSYKLGDIEAALDYLSRFDAPEGILGVGPISFHASLLEANESTEKAAETYVKAAKWDENESTTPYNLYKAATIYFELGDLTKAQNLVDEILEDYASSNEVVNTRRLNGMIASAS